MVFSIDRIVGRIAVLESDDGELIEEYTYKLPRDAKEGTCVSYENGEYTLLRSETERRHKEAQAKLDRLFGRNR